MGEHLRLAGAEMGARDLIVLWDLVFLQRPATPKTTRQRVAPAGSLCRSSNGVLFSHRTLQTTPRVLSSILEFPDLPAVPHTEGTTRPVSPCEEGEGAMCHLRSVALP